MEKIPGVTTASKAWPPLLPAQTIQSKRILKTHPQLQLIALYKPNSGVKKRERERERLRDGVINMFAERVIRIQQLQLSLISYLLHSTRFNKNEKKQMHIYNF